MVPKHFSGALVALLAFCIWPEAIRAHEQEGSEVPTLEMKPKHVLTVKDTASSVSLSADGRRLAMQEGSGARVWDTRKWKELAFFRGSDVPCCCLSSDGRILALALGGTKEIALGNVDSGEVVKTLRVHNNYPGALGFSRDGKLLGSLSCSDHLRVSKIDSGNALPQDYEGDYFSFALAPDGKSVAAGTLDNGADVLDVATGKQLQKLTISDRPITAAVLVAYSQDGHLLAAGLTGFRNIVVVWDTGTWKPIAKVVWNEWTPRGRTEEERNHDLYTRVLELHRENRRAGAFGLAFAPDNKSLLVACNDDRLRVWELATGGLRYEVRLPRLVWSQKGGGCFAAGGTDRVLAIGGGEGRANEVALWDYRASAIELEDVRPADPGKAWDELSSNDPVLAYGRMVALVKAPRETLQMFERRLLPAKAVSAEELAHLVKQLDDDDFELRRSARKTLEDLGERAKAPLESTLLKQPSLEAGKSIQAILALLGERSAGMRVRKLRAIEVLEAIGTEKARQILRRLAGGDKAALLTEEAKCALSRLELAGNQP